MKKTFRVSLSVASLLSAAGVGGALLTGAAAAAPHRAAASTATASNPTATAQHACKVQLRDTHDYRTVPLPRGQVGDYIKHWLLKGYVNWDDPHWRNTGSLMFPNCTPTHLIMIGDSLPFSLGVPMLDGENHHGVELADGSVLGCAFTTRGQFYGRNLRWQNLPAACPNVAQHWAHAAGRFHASAVVVMLGYRDEFTWRIGGHQMHLGQRGFDSYISSQIERFINIVGNHGRRKILFMTVPYAQPRQNDGRIAPPGYPARHRRINQLIESAASVHRGQVSVFDTDSVVSPGNHYDDKLHGKQCRSDGIHFTYYCSQVLQPKVFRAALSLIGS